MKELSIEEKAKAYDKAIKVIKNNLDALNEITETGAEAVNIQSIKNCFYRAFPELKESKESEDEKISEWIKDGLKFYSDAIEDEQGLQKAIAWLEKQVSSDMVADAYLIGCNDTERNWIENQNKQKRWKPNEEQVIDLYCYK